MSLTQVRDRLDGYFKLSERETSILTECRAGVITFLTMGYILAVNASILSDTGGNCSDPFDSECKEEIKIDLIYATAISASVSTLLMGLLANLPLALAPGMGLNAYFAYNVVGYGGTGNVSYENALFATFIEGFIFLILSLTGLRFKMFNYIPKHIKLSMTAGIGLFLAHIGLQSAEGIGLIVADGATLVTLGGCDVSDRVCLIDPDLYCTCSDNTSMEGATTWIGIIGFLLLSSLMIYQVKGSIFITIFLVTFISWFRNTSFTYFGDSDDGNERYDYFKQVVNIHSFDKTPFALFNDIDLSNGDIWIALFTFLYVDMLDTAGTLFSMAEYMDILDKETGTFDGQTLAFVSDAIGTIFGALLGTSSVTTYIESASGIKEGGKTGLTSVIVSFLFLLSLIFSPILASIPPWSTGPALIIIGSLMMKTVLKINWNDMRIGIPSFLTIILMPLTYSIAYGVIAGIMTHLFLTIVDICVVKICNILGRELPAAAPGGAANNNTSNDSDTDNDNNNKNGKPTSPKGRHVPQETPVELAEITAETTPKNDDNDGSGDGRTEGTSQKTQKQYEE